MRQPLVGCGSTSPTASGMIPEAASQTDRPKGKIRCTAACARAWPPVLVKKGVVVPRHDSGIEGAFGTIRRPDGSRQLTLDRRALYTYAHEKPGQVLCNDVDNWFAVKIGP